MSKSGPDNKTAFDCEARVILSQRSFPSVQVFNHWKKPWEVYRLKKEYDTFDYPKYAISFMTKGDAYDFLGALDELYMSFDTDPEYIQSRIQDVKRTAGEIYTKRIERQRAEEEKRRKDEEDKKNGGQLFFDF